jgi:hypothetical protein
MQSVVGQSSNAVGHGTHTAYNYVYNDLIGLPFHTRHHTCEWLLALKRAAWGHAGHATACSCCTTFSAFCRLKNLSKTIEQRSTSDDFRDVVLPEPGQRATRWWRLMTCAMACHGVVAVVIVMVAMLRRGSLDI